MNTVYIYIDDLIIIYRFIFIGTGWFCFILKSIYIYNEKKNNIIYL